jgi:methylmalonyl-CoA mutase cobalamin-binding subunit
VPALLEALRDAGMQHVLVVVGGIIPPQVGGACCMPHVPYGHAICG